MAQIKLFGYADKITIKPGQKIDIHVHADGTDRASAQLVKIIHGDQHPSGPGFIEKEVACEVNGEWDVKKQFTQVGSFLRVADPAKRLAHDGSFTIFGYVWATLPSFGVRQSLIGRWDSYRNEGYCLGINRSGLLEFWLGDGKEVDYVAAEVPLQPRIWYFVAVSFNAETGRAELYQEPVMNRYNSLLGKAAPLDYRSHVAETLRFRAKNGAETPFIMAGSQDWHELRGYFISECFCGKIDRPGMSGRALTREELDRIRDGGPPPPDGLLAYWDTTVGYTENGIGDTVVDVGPYRLDAHGYNRPVRAMTGYNWSGRNDCFRLAPHEYGGVEFHADAMIDCNWEVTRSFTIPRDLKSGVYAIRLRAGPGVGLAEEYVVFFVRPVTPRGRLAFLAPTGSYLAYANEHLSFDTQIIQPMTGQPPIVADIDVEMYKNPDFGFSTYDSYMDGTGVCYSGYHRPLVNMRPKYRVSSMGTTWQLPADLSIIAWLEHQGYDYDVITDEDVHIEGLAALAPYKCVMSGSHPEYVSEPILDAIEDYVADGGRFIYMGGNGFYWNVAYRNDDPSVMEVRKLDSGMRAWAARPGEHYLQTTGDKSGLWKNRGRPPQKIFGVGFIGEGFEDSRAFRRMPDSYHRTVDWMCKGIEGEIIGDCGLAHGGAAGLELDRYDRSLGTPPHAKIIASSGGHTDNFVLSTEEVLYAHAGLGGTQDYRIRADIVFFPTAKDGAMFSTGSIAFGQALPAEGFNNTAAKLLANVVEAFVQDGPLPGSRWIADEKQWR